MYITIEEVENGYICRTYNPQTFKEKKFIAATKEGAIKIIKDLLYFDTEELSDPPF